MDTGLVPMQKSEVIIFKASELERFALKELAERESVSASEMLRRLIRDAARSAGCWPTGNAEVRAARLEVARAVEEVSRNGHRVEV